MSARTRIVGFIVAGTVLGVGGYAVASGLPGAASPTAPEQLTEHGVTVPGPNDNAGTHPDTRGQSADHTTVTSDGLVVSTSQGQGGEISQLATTTTAVGVDKGAEISTAASDARSQAGQNGATSAESASANANGGGTGTAHEASDSNSAHGTGTANTASDGHSASGSGNADH